MGELIGQNVLTTPDEWATTYYVPEHEQIAVKKGDFIGIWVGDQRAGFAGYTSCNKDDIPGTWSNLRILDSDFDDVTYFNPGTTYKFTEAKDVCRVYRVRAVIKP